MSSAPPRRVWRGPRGALLIVQALTIAALLIGGFALILSQVAAGSGPMTLVGVSDAPVSIFLRLRSALIVLGVYLVLAALGCLGVLLFVSTRATGGRIAHTAMTLGSLLFVIIIAIIALTAHGRNDIVAVRDDLLSVWTSAVLSRGDAQWNEICRVEEMYACRGFQDYDCNGCLLGTEAACAPTAGNSGDRCAPCGVAGRDVSDGCWDDMYDALRGDYLGAGVSLVFFAILLLGLLIGTAVLWGKSDKLEAKTIFETIDIPREPTKNGRVHPKSISRIPKKPPRALPYVV